MYDHLPAHAARIHAAGIACGARHVRTGGAG